MTVANYNWTWQEGEDLVMSMIYKEGPLGEEAPVDLTGYSLRMDVVSSNGMHLHTFNSDDIDDVDIVTSGMQGDTVKEAELGDDGTIVIVVPRAPTLPGGSIANIWTGPDPIQVYYDIFLRNNAVDQQSKILRGIITVERSYTKWL
jgi:hypothetical protein